MVCDFGVILSGYCSDQTRTVWLGKPSEEARRAYQAVREAQQAAIEAVKPGNYRRARSMLRLARCYEKLG